MPAKDLTAPASTIEPRNVSVNTMLTETEHRRLKQISRARRATKSSIIRDAVLDLIASLERRSGERRKAT